MASGRRGDASGHGAHLRSRANQAGLRALGNEIEGVSIDGPTANEERLRALGEEIDRHHETQGGGVLAPPRPGGPPPVPAQPPRRKRWSTRRKVLTVLASLVALLVLVVAAGYAYLRYQWSQVKTVQCPSCVAVADGQPFNVLLIGSDTRVGQAASFGGIQAAGQRSDTIKIVHVDPHTGSARLLSIPRDTYVDMSGLPQSSGLTGSQKINTAYNNGPEPLIKTIENSFGIPISHFVAIDFSGVINTVNNLGGINLNFNYPVRDWDCNGQPCNNQSGLDVPKTGCQTLSGTMALALARSRYYEYYSPTDGWTRDGSADLGRITRQNAVVEAIISKAKGTYNPLTLNSFISSMVNNIEVDKSMTFGDMYGLAQRYHAFSPSSLQTYTLPTTGVTDPYGADVEVVDEPAAQQTIAAFLGAAPSTPATPPLDSNANPVSVPSISATPSSSGTVATNGSAKGSTAVTAPPSAKPPVESFDPTPC